MAMGRGLERKERYIGPMVLRFARRRTSASSHPENGSSTIGTALITVLIPRNIMAVTNFITAMFLFNSGGLQHCNWNCNCNLINPSRICNCNCTVPFAENCNCSYN